MYKFFNFLTNLNPATESRREVTDDEPNHTFFTRSHTANKPHRKLYMSFNLDDANQKW